MKKLFSLLLVLVLALSAFATVAAAEAEGTVKMLVNVTGGKDEAEMVLWGEALSAATGLNIVLEKPASDYGNVLMQKLSAGESYDLIYIGSSEYKNLVEQGALTDLTEYINASEILTNNVPASEWEDLKIDGKIYAGFNKRELHILVNVNKNMLAAAGIDYTTIEPTLDGYYNVFKALREANPSEDFYPLNTIMSENWDLQPWMASQGLKGGVVVDEDGQTYVPYATDAAAPVWEWFKKLYDEKLLDPASFVDKTKDMRIKMGAASQQTAVDDSGEEKERK
jgi:putative aldouronate transport system substrate-binding protein